METRYSLLKSVVNSGALATPHALRLPTCVRFLPCTTNPPPAAAQCHDSPSAIFVASWTSELRPRPPRHQTTRRHQCPVQRILHLDGPRISPGCRQSASCCC